MAKWRLWEGSTAVECDKDDWTQCEVHQNLSPIPPESVSKPKFLSEWMEDKKEERAQSSNKRKTKEEVFEDGIVDVNEYSSSSHECELPPTGPEEFTCPVCNISYHRGSETHNYQSKFVWVQNEQ